MVLAGIQKSNLDTGLRRYDVWDLDTHLCGAALRGSHQLRRTEVPEGNFLCAIVERLNPKRHQIDTPT
jgi:hypothetical protein